MQLGDFVGYILVDITQGGRTVSVAGRIENK